MKMNENDTDKQIYDRTGLDRHTTFYQEGLNKSRMKERTNQGKDKHQRTLNT